MARKHIILFTILAICSIASGAVFGLLDLFGFVDGRHTLSLALLVIAAILLYITLLTLFLMELSNNKRERTFFLIVTALFAITFFLMSLHPVLTLLASLAYYLFLLYTHSATISRSHLYIRFSPREIFFPILRRSFTYFLILLALLTYSQSQRLVSENALISPAIVRTVMKPSIFMLNQQINSQLSSVLSSQVFTQAPLNERKTAIQTVLQKTVTSMQDPKTRSIYGFKTEEIPVSKVSIGTDGRVDIAPMIEAMLPSIAYKLNQYVKNYAAFAPLAVALLAYLILQPVIIPLQYFETGLTLIIFKILIKTGLIRIKEEQQIVQIPYV